MSTNTKILFFLLAFLNLMSCTDSSLKKEIAEAYLNLGEDYDTEIIVEKIKILHKHQFDFESLANEEAIRLRTLNELLTGQIATIDSIILIVQAAIETTNCLNKKADKINKMKYDKILKEDSTLLKESTREGLILKLKKHENRVIAGNILNLAESIEIDKTKNNYVLHEINLVLDGKEIKDTTAFISFGNKQLNYIQKNIIIDNK